MTSEAETKMEKVRQRVDHVTSLNEPLLKACGWTPDAYARVVLNAFTITPAIADCEPASINRALLAAMNAGLVPDGKEAVIVPYRQKGNNLPQAQLQPCIQGSIKLAAQATPGLVIRAVTVFAGDEFEYSEGLYPKLNHVPNPAASQREQDVIYVYAVATRHGQPIAYDVMPRMEIDRYRTYSRSPAWEEYFVEQCKNPVIRRLLKRLPKSAHAPAEIAALEHVESLADAAAMSGDPVVDTTTGEIMQEQESAPAATPTPATERAGPTARGRRQPAQPAPQKDEGQAEGATQEGEEEGQGQEEGAEGEEEDSAAAPF